MGALDVVRWKTVQLLRFSRPSRLGEAHLHAAKVRDDRNACNFVVELFEAGAGLEHSVQNFSGRGVWRECAAVDRIRAVSLLLEHSTILG